MNPAFEQRLLKIERVLDKYLPKEASSEWKDMAFGSVDFCISGEHMEPLLVPCERLLSLGGKRWRPLLLVLTAEMTAAAKGKDSSAIENAYSLTPLVEFAHTASLIHDDIEDSADTRRGQPAAHITYGLDTALNAGSWLYFQATTCISTQELSAQKKNDLYDLYLLELRRLHLGQAMDIRWHRDPSLLPSVAEYTAMVRNKTGTLARLAVEVGILAGGGSKEEALEAGKIAEDIGVGFQILDDVTNISIGNPGKKRGDDIVEGKKSLPVILHIKSNPQDAHELEELFEKAAKEGIDSPAVEKAISLLSSGGFIQKAENSGRELVGQKARELSEFFGNADSEAAGLIKELFASMAPGGKL